MRGAWWANPILNSLTPVIEGSEFVTTNAAEVARVAMPQRVPSGFHGNWLPAGGRAH